MSPTIRLVNFDIPAVVNALSTESTARPALLVSYYYLKPFLENRPKYHYRNWVMDSGAFSAHNSGKVIDLQKYIDTCLEQMATDPTLTEVFALDVIGDPEASLKNAEEMWRQGVPAIPCFHQGEPEEFLMHIAKHYPKIALGGVALERGALKLAWLEQCFARVWPKKIHGFGMSSERIVYGLPFHSVDATNWEISVCAFGNWQKFGTMSVRGSQQDLRSQVRYYLDMEAKARVRWAKEMAQLEALPPVKPAIERATDESQPHGRTVRLAVDAGAADGQRAVGAFGKRVESSAKPLQTPPAPKAAPIPSAPKKKSSELDGQSFKYADYWKNRGLQRDPNNLPNQPV